MMQQAVTGNKAITVLLSFEKMGRNLVEIVFCFLLVCDIGMLKASVAAAMDIFFCFLFFCVLERMPLSTFCHLLLNAFVCPPRLHSNPPFFWYPSNFLSPLCCKCPDCPLNVFFHITLHFFPFLTSTQPARSLSLSHTHFLSHFIYNEALLFLSSFYHMSKAKTTPTNLCTRIHKDMEPTDEGYGTTMRIRKQNKKKTCYPKHKFMIFYYFH